MSMGIYIYPRVFINVHGYIRINIHGIYPYTFINIHEYLYMSMGIYICP